MSENQMILDWLIGLIFVQLQWRLSFADSFAIHKERNEKSHTGILLFVSADGTTGTVCRETTASSDITPSKETADVICRVVKNSENYQFHRAEWVDSARYIFNWAQDLPTLLADLQLVCDQNGACKFQFTPSFTCKTNPSNKAYYTTTISCGCDAGYYRTEEGCFKCGNNTYTRDNNISCTPCPTGTSTLGRQDAARPEQCVLICESGHVKVSGRCERTLTIVLSCAGVVVAAALVLMLWYGCRKYRDVIRTMIHEQGLGQGFQGSSGYGISSGSDTGTMKSRRATVLNRPGFTRAETAPVLTNIRSITGTGARTGTGTRTRTGTVTRTGSEPVARSGNVFTRTETASVLTNVGSITETEAGTGTKTRTGTVTRTESEPIARSGNVVTRGETVSTEIGTITGTGTGTTTRTGTVTRTGAGSVNRAGIGTVIDKIEEVSVPEICEYREDWAYE